jgi:dihydroneopterin aldolase
MLLDQDHLRVALRNIVTECRCGLHPWEQYPERPTRLVINVDLYLAVEAGPLPEKDITNYDHIRGFILTFPSRPHTLLLESLANELTAECFKQKNVQACRVSLMKPDIFNEVEGAGIEVFRTRDSWEAKK